VGVGGGSVPELGPAPQRSTLDVDLVRRLVREQFPAWAGLPVRAVAQGGWDNWTFRLGPRMSVRLPSAAEYALAVDKEHRWLPRLAPQLPLPIPTLLGRGAPSPDHPFAWSVLGWLDGDPVTRDDVGEPVRFARDLAGFLAALQRADATGGPAPGTHNWFRGGPLATFDATARAALVALDGQVDAGLVRAVWSTALTAPWDGVPVWFHGDVAAGNLLHTGGTLSAVLDFGTCGVGDPACDLACAWTLLPAAGRWVLRDQLAVDDATWARGRGWALWKTLATCAESPGDRRTERARVTARLVLDEILGEFVAASG